jgi:chemotaxis protein MotA
LQYIAHMTTDPITLGAFLDPAAIGIVAGGTVLATLLRTSLGDVGRGVAALGALARKPFDALGRIARRHGMHALDRSVIADRDVAAAVAGIVDGATPDEITRQLDERRRARILRHAAAADMWAGAAEVAPAMGMVGTLVGLVKMFWAMTDPAAIGAGMAVALLATLYGALVANLIAMPIAVRLRRRARAEAEERTRLVAPLATLAEKGRVKAPTSFTPASV